MNQCEHWSQWLTLQLRSFFSVRTSVCWEEMEEQARWLSGDGRGYGAPNCH